VRNFQTLIVSAVKVCKQCLQTASASLELRPPDLLLGLCIWNPPLGDFRCPDLCYSLPRNEHSWRHHWLEELTLLSNQMVAALLCS